MRAEIEAFCARIGADPLLVQSAGGNVSWKEGDTLWVKASGTWLERAQVQNIFVPVALEPIRLALQAGDFSVTAQAHETSVLRPSIETLLHALMPHTVVAHLHMVEALAHLVRKDGLTEIAAKIGNRLRFALVDYFKPGEQLARAIEATLTQAPQTEVIFLKNHGVVIGASTVIEMESIIASLATLLAQPVRDFMPEAQKPPSPSGYQSVEDDAVQALGWQPKLFARLKDEWALYPDHVVFLGPEALCFNDAAEIKPGHKLVFVRNYGVFAAPDFSPAKRVQLRCYADVMLRQQADTPLSPLSDAQIAELLNWDAEHYRIGIQQIAT